MCVGQDHPIGNNSMLRPTGRWHTFWVAFALVLAAALGFVFFSFPGTFVFGLFLYYASRPIYDRLRTKIGSGNSAAAAALFVLVLPVILLFWYTVSLALGRLATVVMIDIADYQGLLAPYLEFIGPASDIGTTFDTVLSDPGQLLQNGRLREIVATLTSTAGELFGVLLTGLFHLFIALALAFYLLRDDDRIVGWIRTNASDELLIRYGRAVDTDLQTVFFGNILNAVLTGIIGTGVFLLLARIAPTTVPLPVPILLGLLTGIGSLIPVVGMKIIYLPITLLLLVRAVIADPQLVWFPVVFFIVTAVFVDLIPDFVLRPFVSGRNLHIGLVMFAYLFGPLLFGWYGIFLGPFLVVLLSNFAEIVVPELTNRHAPPLGPHSNRTDGTETEENTE